MQDQLDKDQLDTHWLFNCGAELVGVCNRCRAESGDPRTNWTRTSSRYVREVLLGVAEDRDEPDIVAAHPFDGASAHDSL